MSRFGAKKRLTLVVKGADRQLWRGELFRVVLRDLFGKRILHDEEHSGPRTRLCVELQLDAGQRYGLHLSQRGHQPAWYVLSRRNFLTKNRRKERAELILQPILVPDQARSYDLSGGFGRLLARRSRLADGGLAASEYLRLTTPCQMALLNIEAKLRETPLDDERRVLDFVRGVRLVERDRVYLWLLAAAKDLVRRSPEFSCANGHGARKDVPDLPTHPDSWKHTRFAEGNLQLSFAGREQEVQQRGQTVARCFSVDADIDLARGLGHVGEWLHNHVFEPGHKTDQREVYRLLCHQGIFPAYTLAQTGQRFRAGDPGKDR